MYTVYVHIFPNGKRYVGLTSQNVEKKRQAARRAWARKKGGLDV